MSTYNGECVFARRITPGAQEGMMNYLFNDTIDTRETPTGREYEATIIFRDCMILIVGCIALAINFAPLVYAAALGHLILGFALSVNKGFWMMSEPLIIAVTASLLIGGIYAVQVFYFGILAVDVTKYVSADWPALIAQAIVVGGIISYLFSHPGVLDLLREHLDRTAG
jgi:hypothetical protein